MSRPSQGALVGATLLVYVLAAGVFLLTSFLGAPPTLLASLVRRYAISSALLRIVENLPALSVAGSLVAFTLFARVSTGSGAPATVQTVVRPALVVLMVLTLGYMLADALGAPRLRGIVTGIENASLRAAEYREVMDTARARAERTSSSADWAQARDAATRYLAIDPGNEEVARLENELHDSLLQARDREGKSVPAEPDAARPGGEESVSPAELIRLAERYMQEGDWYSAHYYASLAQSSPEVAARASELVAAADERITPRTPLDRKATPEETAARLLADLKREAYDLYQREEWVSAYYRFGELAAVYPDDPDILRFREESRKRAMETAFLVDDARTALLEDGAEGLLFVTRRDKEIEVTTIGKMVRLPIGTYFADLETLRYRPGSGPTFHVYARYGKLASDRILLRALDATRPEASEEPVVLVAPGPDELATVMRPGQDLDRLQYVHPDPRALRGVPALTLWGMQAWARESGILAEALDLELLLFFVRPALFLALGLLGVGAAIRMRGRYFGRPALVAWASLGLFPLALTGVWQISVDGARLLYGSVIAAASFVPAIVAAAAVQGVLLVVALIVLSRNALE